MAIKKIVPYSVKLYHELFHLTNTADRVPNPFSEQYEPLINEILVRENPDTYVFFSVGYWYFLRTNENNPNERWTFESGVTEVVSIE
ncbi:hypothetical protein N7453_000352 [Penicillium expansum]|nr:hypothetical protein N7453_000352 [Penicillium expansum]